MKVPRHKVKQTGAGNSNSRTTSSDNIATGTPVAPSMVIDEAMQADFSMFDGFYREGFRSSDIRRIIERQGNRRRIINFRLWEQSRN